MRDRVLFSSYLFSTEEILLPLDHITEIKTIWTYFKVQAGTGIASMVHLSYGAIQFEALCYNPVNGNCGTKRQIFSGINYGIKSSFSLDDKASTGTKQVTQWQGAPLGTVRTAQVYLAVLQWTKKTLTWIANEVKQTVLKACLPITECKSKTANKSHPLKQIVTSFPYSTA